MLCPNCVSGQPGCTVDDGGGSDDEGDNWIMVAAGYSDTVEVVSLDPENHPVPECARFPAVFPHVGNLGAVGAALTDG